MNFTAFYIIKKMIIFSCELPWVLSEETVPPNRCWKSEYANFVFLFHWPESCWFMKPRKTLGRVHIFQNFLLIGNGNNFLFTPLFSSILAYLEAKASLFFPHCLRPLLSIEWPTSIKHFSSFSTCSIIPREVNLSNFSFIPFFKVTRIFIGAENWAPLALFCTLLTASLFLRAITLWTCPHLRNQFY